MAGRSTTRAWWLSVPCRRVLPSLVCCRAAADLVQICGWAVLIVLRQRSSSMRLRCRSQVWSRSFVQRAARKGPRGKIVSMCMWHACSHEWCGHAQTVAVCFGRLCMSWTQHITCLGLSADADSLVLMCVLHALRSGSADWHMHIAHATRVRENVDPLRSAHWGHVPDEDIHNMTYYF